MAISAAHDRVHRDRCGCRQARNTGVSPRDPRVDFVVWEMICGTHRAMQEHPNAQRIRRLFTAFQHGDLATIQELIPQNAVWHFPGRRGKLAGEHVGRDAVFAFLMNVQALTGNSFHLDLIDVLANDHNAVAVFRGHGQRDAKTLDNPTCLRMRLNDAGQVIEVWEFVWDLYHVDDFWS